MPDHLVFDSARRLQNSRTPTRILLAIDNSRYSEAATQAIASLIRTQDAEVFVLHVVESPYVDTEKHQNQLEQARKWVQDAAGTLNRVGFKTDTSVTHLGENNIQDVILEFAAQWHPGLIVLGSHGRTGLKRFLIGSVSDAVSRHAPCSVLIVRMPPSQCSEE